MSQSKGGWYRVECIHCDLLVLKGTLKVSRESSLDAVIAATRLWTIAAYPIDHSSYSDISTTV